VSKLPAIGSPACSRGDVYVDVVHSGDVGLGNLPNCGSGVLRDRAVACLRVLPADRRPLDRDIGGLAALWSRRLSPHAAKSGNSGGYGVMAMASGSAPTPTAGSALLVATLTGVTESEPALQT
jgi:hypothetical protein